MAQLGNDAENVGRTLPYHLRRRLRESEVIMFGQPKFTDEHYKIIAEALHKYEKAPNPQYMAKYYIADMLRRDSSDFETSSFIEMVEMVKVKMPFLK